MSAFDTRRQARSARTHRQIRVDETAALLASDIAQAAIALHGTPVLLLDPETVRRQFRRLTAALPFVGFHYAVKALSHEAVIEALADEGCGFDVATGAELALLDGIDRTRIIHTHPVKKASEIAEALAAGVRTFVVDNEAELDKFTGAPQDVRLLVRLAYRSPNAKSDLSTKFGVGPFEAAHLVERALEQGIRIGGFSFHVGSQLDDPARFAVAIRETLALMDHLEATLDVRFETLDIGGGFPVAYDSAVTPLEDLAAMIRPLLETRADRLSIIAEPGRVLVAEAMTLVTSVVGIAERSDGRWYYLDDGLYGSYSNVLAEDVHPLIFSERELAGRDADSAAHRWATLAGPTCDSSDVIAREALLPQLEVGDMLVSPVMGAYTAVTSTRFNGRTATPVAVVGQGARTGELTAVAQVDSISDAALV
ncbi:MAG TPA: type III PLP-dependent enzyme [Microbacterium sp.]|nr:type III PLP-dependent enzyme [Microbacterium sp.]